MKTMILFCFLALQIASSAQAVTAPPITLRYLSQDSYAALKAEIPDFPSAGSTAEQADIVEIFRLQTTRTAAECVRANSIIIISSQAFFGTPYGPLSLAQVAIIQALFEHVHSDLNYFVARMKSEFARPRPYDYVSGIDPCVPKDSSLAYPSGHAATAALEALVLSDVYPKLALPLQRRGDQIAEDRVLGGVHHPSDIQAGELLAGYLFTLLKTSPAYQQDLKAVRAQTLR